MRYCPLLVSTLAGILILASACTSTSPQTTPQIATGQKIFNLPYCKITSPRDNTHFSKPTAIHVTADVDARDKHDQSVTVKFVLYKGIPPMEKEIQSLTVTSPPYTVDFAEVPTGIYCIFAKASKPSIGGEISSRVDVTVGEPAKDAMKVRKAISIQKL